MNLPPISEEIFVLCIVLATMVGLVVGYAWKVRTHEKEIDAILRIAKRIEEAPKKERAPTAGPHQPTKIIYPVSPASRAVSLNRPREPGRS